MNEADLLLDNDLLLYRQVHPNDIHKGQLASSAFTPGSNDDKKLSCDLGSMIGARESWERYRRETGNQSLGVLGLTVGDCLKHNLLVFHDRQGHEAHCVVDFGRLTSRNQIRKTGKRLSEMAKRNDWCFLSGSYDPLS